METKELKIPLKIEPDFKTQDDLNNIEVEPISFKNKIPAHWTIVECESGVRCTNTTSREIFEGSIEDFNKLLRG